jgi:hypothetical protein
MSTTSSTLASILPKGEEEKISTNSQSKNCSCDFSPNRKSAIENLKSFDDLIRPHQHVRRNLQADLLAALRLTMPLTQAHAAPAGRPRCGPGKQKGLGILSEGLSSAPAPRLSTQDRAASLQPGWVAPQLFSLRTSFRVLFITPMEPKKSVIYGETRQI